MVEDLRRQFNLGLASGIRGALEQLRHRQAPIDDDEYLWKTVPEIQHSTSDNHVITAVFVSRTVLTSDRRSERVSNENC